MGKRARTGFKSKTQRGTTYLHEKSTGAYKGKVEWADEHSMKRAKEMMAQVRASMARLNKETRKASEAQKGFQSSVTAVAVSIDGVRGAVTSYFSIQTRLAAMTLALTRAQWSLNDANREYGRLAARNYQLDVRRAEVSLKLANRQLLVTQRTGRQLDIQMSQINIEMQARDISLAKFNAYDKELKVKRDMIEADLQMQLVHKQMNYMYANMITNLVAVNSQMWGFAIATWKAVAANAALQATMRPYAIAATIGAIATTVGSVYAIQKMYFDKPEARGAGLGKVPSAQTDEVGEVKVLEKDGIYMGHAGERVSRGGGSGGGGNIVMNFNITGGDSAGIAVEVRKEVERFLLQRTTLSRPGTNFGVR